MRPIAKFGTALVLGATVATSSATRLKANLGSETGYMFLAGERRDFVFKGEKVNNAEELLCKSTNGKLNQDFVYNKLPNGKYGQGSAGLVENEYLLNQRVFLGPGDVPDQNSNGKVDAAEKINTVIHFQKSPNGLQKIVGVSKVLTQFDSSYTSSQTRSHLSDRPLTNFSVSVEISSQTCPGSEQVNEPRRLAEVEVSCISPSIKDASKTLPVCKTETSPARNFEHLTPFPDGNMYSTTMAEILFQLSVIRSKKDVLGNTENYAYYNQAEWSILPSTSFTKPGAGGSLALNEQGQVVGVLGFTPVSSGSILKDAVDGVKDLKKYGEIQSTSGFVNLQNESVRKIHDDLSLKLAAEFKAKKFQDEPPNR